MTGIIASVLSVAKPRSTGVVADLDWPVLAAHRGGASVWPQNTLTAFRNAVEANPSVALEMDVQALKDGTLVVYHDTNVTGLSANGMTANLKDMTAEQWKTLRVKSPTGGQSAPASTLAEVFDEFGGTDVPLVIELKNPSVRDKFVEAVWPYRDQVIVQSFDPTVVSQMVRSGLKTLQLADDSSVKLVDGIHSVGVQTRNITSTLIDQARAKDVKVWAWGNEVTIGQFNSHDRGLDGYMVNDPRP